MPPNHYLSVAVDYLFRHRPGWRADTAVGKTVVTTAMIDRVARRLDAARCSMRRSASSGSRPGCWTAAWAWPARRARAPRLLRRDGRVWTTDKDGIAAALLAAEITARTGDDPSQCLLRQAHCGYLRHGRYADRVEGAGHARTEGSAGRS